MESLVAALRIFSCHTQDLFSCNMWTLSCIMWYLIPPPGSNSGPLHWELRVFTTGPPAKSLIWLLLKIIKLVYCTIIYNSQDRETTQMSVNSWMDKEAVAQVYNGTLSHQKQQNNAMFSNRNGPRDYYTKWSQKEKDKYHMWNLEYDTNELIYKIETNSHREQACGCQVGRQGLGVWD